MLLLPKPFAEPESNPTSTLFLPVYFTTSSFVLRTMTDSLVNNVLDVVVDWVPKPSNESLFADVVPANICYIIIPKKINFKFKHSSHL